MKTAEMKIRVVELSKLIASGASTKKDEDEYANLVRSLKLKITRPQQTGEDD